MLKKVRGILVYTSLCGALLCFIFPPYTLWNREGEKVFCEGGWAFEPAVRKYDWGYRGCSVDWSTLALRVTIFLAVAGGTYILARSPK